MITPALVTEFWQYMNGAFGAQVVSKASSKNMEAIAWFLDALSIMDHDKFMKSYVTTIDRTIYIPFTIGDDSDWSLWNQITVCAHEHQHVFQAATHGTASFALDYVLSASSRAHYEAEALRADMELHYWRFRRLPDIPATAAKLKAYSCGQKEIEYVEHYLEVSSETIGEGAIISESAQAAIPWLEQNAPELQEDRRNSR